MNRLKQKYQKEALPALKTKYKLKNDLAVPRLKKIVINIGITDEQHRNKAIESVTSQIATIAGQKPNTRTARQSIAGFKLRAGDPVGLTVTLRGQRLYQFIDKLISIVLPRVKDFQGLSLKSFDGQGNYSFGLTEQIIFPEIDYDKIDQIRGLEITVVTSAQSDSQAKDLLEILGFPFEKDTKSTKNN